MKPLFCRSLSDQRLVQLWQFPEISYGMVQMLWERMKYRFVECGSVENCVNFANCWGMAILGNLTRPGWGESLVRLSSTEAFPGGSHSWPASYSWCTSRQVCSSYVKPYSRMSGVRRFLLPENLMAVVRGSGEGSYLSVKFHDQRRVMDLPNRILPSDWQEGVS